jgi:hypothetical protein
MTTTTNPDVPLPDGAEWTSDWEDVKSAHLQHFTYPAWAVAYVDAAGCVRRRSGIDAAAG